MVPAQAAPRPSARRRERPRAGAGMDTAVSICTQPRHCRRGTASAHSAPALPTGGRARRRPSARPVLCPRVPTEQGSNTGAKQHSCGGRAAGESAGPRRQRAQGRMQHHTGRCPLVEVEDVRRAQRGDTEKGHGCGGACSQRLRIRAYHIVCWRRKISNRLHTHEISQPKFPEFSSYRPGRGGERRSREPSRLDATGTPSVSYNTAKIVIIARTRLRVLRKKVRTQHTHTHTCAHPGMIMMVRGDAARVLLGFLLSGSTLLSTGSSWTAPRRRRTRRRQGCAQ